MKAAIITRYGPPDVFQLQDVAKPVPKDDEVLIKVHATPVSFGEIKARNFTPSLRDFWLPGPLWLPARLAMGFSKPRKTVLGSEFAGEIEDVGKDVTRFKKGDEVFGYPGDSFGANAEYLCMAEDAKLALKPANMTFEEAATVPYGGLNALYFLRRGNIQAGQNVLIYGASGGVGQFAVQLAKHFGAEVTGVCSTQKTELVRSLGADKIVDYTQEDFAQNGQAFDLIFDTVGKTSFAHCRGCLKPGGRYVLAAFGMKQLLQMLWTSLTGDKKVICGLSSENKEDLVFLKDLIEAGKIKSVIDKRFPLEQIAGAHRYVEDGHRKGHVVITVAHNAVN